jgi:hypothetical protein
MSVETDQFSYRALDRVSKPPPYDLHKCRAGECEVGFIIYQNEVVAALKLIALP